MPDPRLILDGYLLHEYIADDNGYRLVGLIYRSADPTEDERATNEASDFMLNGTVEFRLIDDGKTLRITRADTE